MIKVSKTFFPLQIIMPRKRSKSEERERKRKYRESRTPEKVELDREKAQKRMKEINEKKSEEEKQQQRNISKMRMRKTRENLNNDINFDGIPEKYLKREKEENMKRIRKIRSHQTEEENMREKLKTKERMRALRARLTEEEKEIEREELRNRMKKLRLEKKVEDSDYEKIVQRQKLRGLRANFSGKQHLIANLKAKKGMQLLNNEGRLRTFSGRDSGISKAQRKNEFLEWKNYLGKSEGHQQRLAELKPDLVERINEHFRLEKENKNKKEESQREGVKASEHSRCGDWYWASDTESEDGGCYEILTKEEKDFFEKEEKREREVLSKRLKEEQKEKKKIRKQKLKEAMAKPIDPLPERELCQYERIREDIIKEREEAMAKFKFFENLEKTKKSIGIYKHDNK